MIWYSTLRATKYNRIQHNYPRLTPPREHANATTKAYAKPRDWSVQMCGDGSLLLSHTPPEAGTRRGVAFEPLCVPPEKGAPRGVE